MSQDKYDEMPGFTEGEKHLDRNYLSAFYDAGFRFAGTVKEKEVLDLPLGVSPYTHEYRVVPTQTPEVWAQIIRPHKR